MRKAQEEEKEEKKRKERFEKASFRFGNVNKYENIPKMMNDISEDQKSERDVVFENYIKDLKFSTMQDPGYSGGDSASIQPSNSRFGRTEEEKRRLYYLEQILKQVNIKKKLLKAYGPRDPVIYSGKLAKEAEATLSEFYAKITESQNTELNKDLQKKFALIKNKAYEQDFDDLNAQYVHAYGQFLRDQQNCDGWRKFNIKLMSEARRMKYLILHPPKLEKPKIFHSREMRRMKKKGGVRVLGQGSETEINNQLPEDEQLTVEAMSEYDRRMQELGDELARYKVDLEGGGILGEVDEFLKETHYMGGTYYTESESVLAEEDELNRVKGGKVDVALGGPRGIFRTTDDGKRGDGGGFAGGSRDGRITPISGGMRKTRTNTKSKKKGVTFEDMQKKSGGSWLNLKIGNSVSDLDLKNLTKSRTESTLRKDRRRI